MYLSSGGRFFSMNDLHLISFFKQVEFDQCHFKLHKRSVPCLAIQFPKFFFFVLFFWTWFCCKPLRYICTFESLSTALFFIMSHRKRQLLLNKLPCPVNQRYVRLLGPNARCRSQQRGDGGCGHAVWAALRQIMCVVTPPPPPTPSSASHIITIPLGNTRRLGEQGGETGEMVHSLAHVIER